MITTGAGLAFDPRPYNRPRNVAPSDGNSTMRKVTARWSPGKADSSLSVGGASSPCLVRWVAGCFRHLKSFTLRVAAKPYISSVYALGGGGNCFVRSSVGDANDRS